MKAAWVKEGIGFRSDFLEKKIMGTSLGPQPPNYGVRRVFESMKLQEVRLGLDGSRVVVKRSRYQFLDKSKGKPHTRETKYEDLVLKELA